MKSLERRTLGNVFTLIIAAAFIAAWAIWANQSNSRFRKHEIESLIIKSDDWWKRSIQFELDDGYSFYVQKPIDSNFQVGDSIYKPANSTTLNVYRNSANAEFQLLFCYDALHSDTLLISN